MIIDCHAHVSAPAELWAYRALITAHRGAHGRGAPQITDEEIKIAANKKEMAPCGHLDMMHQNQITRQLLSPRPFQLMHSERPGFLVHWFAEECNNIIHRTVNLFPNEFVGVCALPQVAGEPIENVLPELERCITKLGMRGCLLNPDPYENSGTEAPPLGDRYWYPLYEKLCELDVPAHIHATGSRSLRSPYTLHFINEETIAIYNLVNSDVLTDFPDLKIIVSHGGGAIPYQIGRFESGSLRSKRGSFTEGLRKLYFDTVLYSEGALKLLIETVGADRCLFGAECPGVGSMVNPHTHRTFDDIVPIIKSFEWLGDADRERILRTNAEEVFGLNSANASS